MRCREMKESSLVLFVRMFVTMLKIHFLFLLLSPSKSACSQERPISSTKTSNHQDPQMTTLTEVLEKLLEHYDRTLRPNHFGPALIISTDLYITEIPWTSEMDMEFSVNIVLRQSWTDNRLQLPFNATPDDNIPFTHEFSQKIWTPDTFFPNEKRSNLHSATEPNYYIRLYPNGRVSSSIHLTLTSSCPMQLVFFPMDYQVCSIVMESYAFDEKRVQYVWDPEVITNFGEHSVGLLQNFQLTAYKQTKGVRKYTTGNYTSLKLDLLLSRYLSYYVMQMYLPIAMTVIISWFPFWVEGKAAWERIGIGVTTILTMASLLHSIQQSSPRVSYMTALDVYTKTSFVLVFLSLLESAIVCHLNKKGAYALGDIGLRPSPDLERHGNWNSIQNGELRRLKKISLGIDKACRIGLPGGFLLFNAAYWISSLSISAIPNDPSWVTNLQAQSFYAEGDGNI